MCCACVAVGGGGWGGGEELSFPPFPHSRRMGVSPSSSSSPLRTVLLDADAKSEIRERRKSKIYVGSCRRNCLPVVPEPPLLVSLLLLFLPPSVFKDDTDIIADSFSRRSICSFLSPYLPHRRRTFSRAGGQSVTPCHSPAVRRVSAPLGLCTARRLLRQSDTASFSALPSMHSNSIGRQHYVVVASEKDGTPPYLFLCMPLRGRFQGKCLTFALKSPPKCPKFCPAQKMGKTGGCCSSTCYCPSVQHRRKYRQKKRLGDV